LIDEGQQNVQYTPHVDYLKDSIFGYRDSDGHAFNYKCLQNIDKRQNLNFDSIKHLIQRTQEGDPFVSSFSNGIPAYQPFTYGMSTLYDYATGLNGTGFGITNNIPRYIKVAGMVVCGTIKGAKFYLKFNAKQNTDNLSQDYTVIPVSSWEEVKQVYQEFEQSCVISQAKPLSMVVDWDSHESINSFLYPIYIKDDTQYVYGPPIGYKGLPTDEIGYNGSLYPLVRVSFISEETMTRLFGEKSYGI
jgi:hypothetical protein